MSHPISVVSERGWIGLSSLPASFRLVTDHARAALIDGALPDWSVAAHDAVDRGLDLIVFAPSMTAAADLTSLGASVDAGHRNCIVVPRWSARELPVWGAGPPFEYLDMRISGTHHALGSNPTAMLHCALLIETLGVPAPAAWTVSASATGFVAAADSAEHGAVTVVVHDTAQVPEPGVDLRAVRGGSVLELHLTLDGDGAPSRARHLESAHSVEAAPVYASAFRRGLISAASALDSPGRTNDMTRLAELARAVETAGPAS